MRLSLAMIKTEKGFRFECSGREMDTFGFDGFSIYEGVVAVGKDCHPQFLNPNTLLYTSEFSEAEKKELSIFMIIQWTKFGLR